MSSILGKFTMAMFRAVFGLQERSEGSVTVTLDVRDENGDLVSSGSSEVKARVSFDSRLKLFGWLLLALFTAIAVSVSPEIGWCFPLLGRVATVGLNQLLTATFGSPATWFIGLMGAVSTTGVTTASSATFTDANGTFAASDVNRQILLMGVGPGGTDLLTTIAARASATSITLGTTASVSMTGVRYALECRAADTMGSHTSFAEDTNYNQSTRPAFTPGTPSGGSVDNSASQASYTMNATTYVFGAFLVNESTKSGATGTLYGAGVSSGGLVARVLSGYTINVTVTPSVTAT